MKIKPDCIPCLINMTLRMARVRKASQKQEEIIIKKILNKLPKIYPTAVPPFMAKEIYVAIEEVMGPKDIYLNEKRKSNKIALKYYPKIRKDIERSKNGLLKAIKFSAAANVIDFGAYANIQVIKEIDKIVKNKNIKTGLFQINKFRKLLKNSQNILFLADNAGETVFDRILLENISKIKIFENIYYVVKNKPVLNDALSEDAYFCGLHNVAKIIKVNSPAPGLLLDHWSKKFKEIYKKADIIISKGQGNYESLSELHDKRIFFLLRAKCPVIADSIGCRVGEINLFNLK